MEMDLITAFLFMILAFAIGDFISTITNAFVPSLFVAAVIFLVGFWTFWPKDIANIAGFSSPLMSLATYLILVNMGTSISVKQLIASWKTVVLALAAMAGLTAVILLIGGPIIGREATLVASPVLAGGIMASIIMSKAAEAKGLMDLATLSALVLVAQGFVGYPLTSLALRKEGTRLIEKFRGASDEEKKKLLAVDDGSDGKAPAGSKSIVPEKFRTDSTYLLQTGILAFVSIKLAGLTNGTVPATIACLIAGVLGTEFGFVDAKPVNKAHSMGFITIINLVLALNGLGNATPEMLQGLVVPLLIVIVLGVTGLALVSIPVGKAFGYSPAYAIALGLNCLLGFPPNMIITNDVARALGKDKVEESYLNEAMLPNMLIAGFVTVSIGSVVLASIFAGML